jgi:hypothetical protein
VTVPRPQASRTNPRDEETSTSAPEQAAPPDVVIERKIAHGLSRCIANIGEPLGAMDAGLELGIVSQRQDHRIEEVDPRVSSCGAEPMKSSVTQTAETRRAASLLAIAFSISPVNETKWGIAPNSIDFGMKSRQIGSGYLRENGSSKSTVPRLPRTAMSAA